MENTRVMPPHPNRKVSSYPNRKSLHNSHRTAILDATNAQLCQMVDSHFDLVYSMTNNRQDSPGRPAPLSRDSVVSALTLYRSLNGRDVDTLPFRRAVWCDFMSAASRAYCRCRESYC
jgi:hypothetical protein